MNVLWILQLALALACIELLLPCSSQEQLLQTYGSLPIDDTHNHDESLHIVADFLTETYVEVSVATIKHFWLVEVPQRLQLIREGEEIDEELEREKRGVASGSGASEHPTNSEDLLRPLHPENFPENFTLPFFLAILSIPSDGFPGSLLGNISTECLQGWATLFNNTGSSGLSNGLRAIDAFGKLGAGYFQGNIYALGSYDECLAIDNTHYCLADLVMSTQPPTNPQIHYALCLPRACSEDDIARSFKSVNSRLETFGITNELSSVTCESENKPPYSAGAMVMLSVCSLFVLMVIGGSTVHLGWLYKERRKKASNGKTSGVVERGTATSESRKREKEKKGTMAMKCLDFVVAFSLFKTVPTILSTTQHSSAITCLNGIRVISMFWVILGHTHIWSFLISDNPLHVLNNVASRFTYQAVSSGVFAVDSFFCS